MRKIAVTGSIGTGKSTVCRILKESGAYVIDADEIVRQLLAEKSPYAQQVIKLLGPDIITQNRIDRKKVSNIVFSNPDKLKLLESILHPAVRTEINHLFATVKQSSDYLFFVAEVPLLYEAQMEKDFDAVITVTADEETARQRAMNGEEFDRRSRFHLSQTAKQAKATYVIKNQESLTDLKAQVTGLIPQLLSDKY